VENTEPTPPPDGGSSGGSLDPFKDGEGWYVPDGTYSDTQAQIFKGFRVTISNSATSSVSGLTLVKTVVCPVKRWIHGHGLYTGLTLKAALCLENSGKISWKCGSGTTCLPFPLSDGSLLSGGSGELAQKGVCQGPPTPLTNREGYRATLCQNNSDCPAEETCADSTDPPRRLALSICSKTSTTTAGTETCHQVIQKKVN